MIENVKLAQCVDDTNVGKLGFGAQWAIVPIITFKIVAVWCNRWLKSWTLNKRNRI